MDCSSFFAEQNPVSFVEEPGPTALQQVRVAWSESAPSLAQGAQILLSVSSCYESPYGGPVQLWDLNQIQLSAHFEDGALIADIPDYVNGYALEGLIVDSITVQAETTAGEPVVATFANKNNWGRSAQRECEAWNGGVFDTADWCLEPSVPTPPEDQPEPESTYECTSGGVSCSRIVADGFYYDSEEQRLLVHLSYDVYGHLSDARLVLFSCDCSEGNTCEAGTQRVETVIGKFVAHEGDGDPYYSFGFPLPSSQLASAAQALIHLETECGDRAEFLYIESGGMRCESSPLHSQRCLSAPPVNETPF